MGRVMLSEKKKWEKVCINYFIDLPTFYVYKTCTNTLQILCSVTISKTVTYNPLVRLVNLGLVYIAHMSFLSTVSLADRVLLLE